MTDTNDLGRRILQTIRSVQVLLGQRQPDVFLSLEPNSLVKWPMLRVVEQEVDERTMTVIGKTPSGGPISLAIE